MICASIGQSTDQEIEENIEVLPALLFIILRIKSSPLNAGFVTSVLFQYNFFPYSSFSFFIFPDAVICC